MKKLESNFLSFHLCYYLLKYFCQIRGSRIQKMTVKGFSITLWVQKMMVKGFSITLWIQKMMVKGFSIIFWRPFVCSSLTSFFNPVYAMFFMQQFWLPIVFLMTHQECHYSQSDMVVIEFTGPRPLYLKSPRLKPRTFQVLGPWPVNSITTMSSWL